MTKLIIFSDTHGNRKSVEALRPLIAENDIVVHLGDGVADLREITREFPEKTYACAGNCDFFSPYPEGGIIEAEKFRIFYCHGHNYGVKRELTALAAAAKARGCSIALYGHTHRAKIEKIDGITLINPGSLHYPLERGGSYCYLVLHKDELTPTIVGTELF